MKPRIINLELLTAAPLNKMKDFYNGKLGLPVLSEKADEITIKAGETMIKFVGTTEGEPFYHVAFNIPENKIMLAREWQLKRTSLFLTQENLRDPKYPNDVRHFRNWNAHSVFFWDPAGNVLEYIARHDLKNSAAGDFSTNDILYASEIAFTVDKVPEAASRIENAFGLQQFGNASKYFHALGDNHGLLLVFKRGRDIGDYMRGFHKPVSVFATLAGIRSDKQISYKFSEYPYQISSA